MKKYGYVNNESSDEDKKKKGAMKIYAHEVNASNKLDQLVKLVISHVEKFDPDVRKDRMTILCESDTQCQIIYAELCRKNIKTGIITKDLKDDQVLDVWGEFSKRIIKVVVVNTDSHEDAGLPFGKIFLIAYASFTPAVLSKLLGEILKKRTEKKQNVHVDVLASEDDPFKSLEALALKIEEERVIPVPQWLSQMISEKSRKRSRDSDSEATPSISDEPTPKRLKSIYDLKPDKNGIYFCPDYLLRIPNDDNELIDDGEEDDLQDHFAEGEPPQFD